MSSTVEKKPEEQKRELLKTEFRVDLKPETGPFTYLPSAQWKGSLGQIKITWSNSAQELLSSDFGNDECAKAYGKQLTESLLYCFVSEINCTKVRILAPPHTTSTSRGIDHTTDEHITVSIKVAAKRWPMYHIYFEREHTRLTITWITSLDRDERVCYYGCVGSFTPKTESFDDYIQRQMTGSGEDLAAVEHK